jgi:formyltetrahydrofolate-dependent phosphoribosylglycinamide formyltransferase
MRRIRTAVLISGSGSNMMSLVEAARGPAYPAEIAVVVSNKLDAPGLEKARKAKIPVVGVDHRPFGDDRVRHERLIQAVLVEAGVELVCLAGYMRILTPYLVGAWSGRMINIHPSLLPAFTGVHTHRRALEAGVTEHGCSVHWVIDALDEGPVIGQARVPVLSGDTEDTLAARVLAQEHKLYPACLAKAAEALTG